MAAKRVDPLKAKAAKQKKIAIGGVVVLVALLAFQGPKTLKMLQGPQPVTPPAAATPTTTGPAPATAAGAVPAVAPVAGAVPAAPAAELASVPDSDQAPVVDEGQLATFERFSSKDPFAQQATAVTATKPAATKPEETKPEETKPAATPTDASTPTGSGATDAGATDGGFTTVGNTPPAAATLATANSIAVNGVAEDVVLKAAFPAEQPTFVLVSVALDGKSAEIGIAGGQYANGGETLKLSLGKKITLQNTADGSRYELELLSLQGFPLPKRKG